MLVTEVTEPTMLPWLPASFVTNTVGAGPAVVPVSKTNPVGAFRIIVPVEIWSGLASESIGPVKAVHVAVPFVVFVSAEIALPPVA